VTTLPRPVDAVEASLVVAPSLVPPLAWSFLMMDAVMLAIGLAFFVASIAYVYACDML
jgi:hypothetical protein